MIVSVYQYEVEFRSTAKHANVDGLSRLPLEVTAEEDALTQAPSLFRSVGKLHVKHNNAQMTSSDPIAFTSTYIFSTRLAKSSTR